MKQRLQGIVLGVILTILIMVTVVTVAAANTRTIGITYGINVVVNGIRQIFPTDMQPFTSEGRTFLPVRGIADALGLDVSFNPVTQTVYLDSLQAIHQHTPPTPTPLPTPTPMPTPIPTPTPIALRNAAPFFDSNAFIATGGNMTLREHRVGHSDARMGGQLFSDAVVYYMRFWQVVGGPASGYETTQFSLHNLNADFSTLTGHFGRVDGTMMLNARLNIIGDGNVLLSQQINAQDLPVPINISVHGVRQLRIEILVNGRQGSISYAFHGFLE